MFADECIIFCKASRIAARNVKEVLHNYCMVSGQLINYHKSLVQFSKGSNRTTREIVTNILQIPQSNRLGTYLGCKNIDHKRMRSDFDGIMHKMKHKLTGWKARFLSQAGKSILIKSNMAGIPQYTMQGIKITNYIAKEMDKVNRDFF